MNDLSIVVPRVQDGKIVQVEAKIDAEKWSTSDPKLARTLSYLHLETGHHADRDLELATIAVHLLGGEIHDNRPKPKNLERMPR